MPAALELDWEAIKTHCIAHGIPDAAKKYGITQDVIRQRCHRYGWKNNPDIADALSRHSVTVSRPTQKEASVLYVESVKDKLLRTRANHAETALIASAEMLAMAETCPASLRDPELVGVLLNHAKHAALTGSWQSSAPTPKMNLAVTGNVTITQEHSETQEAEWSEMPSQPVEPDILDGF